MVYPARPRHEVLPEFAGTNTTRPTTEQRAHLIEYVSREYRAGRSIHELAELTGRSHTAVRRALDDGGVPRRPPGAQRSRL